jgi:hypothetical protein
VLRGERSGTGIVAAPAGSASGRTKLSLLCCCVRLQPTDPAREWIGPLLKFTVGNWLPVSRQPCILFRPWRTSLEPASVVLADRSASYSGTSSAPTITIWSGEAAICWAWAWMALKSCSESTVHSMQRLKHGSWQHKQVKRPGKVCAGTTKQGKRCSTTKYVTGDNQGEGEGSPDLALIAENL